MYQKTGIPVEKAKVILKFGIADAMILNRFRSVFDKDVNEEWIMKQILEIIQQEKKE